MKNTFIKLEDVIKEISESNDEKSLSDSIKRAFIVLGKTDIPIVGGNYKCRCVLQKDRKKFCTKNMIIENIEKVVEISSDIFIVKSQNTIYVVKILDRKIGNVQIAVIKTKPKLGYSQFIHKINLENNRLCVKDYQTTKIKSIKEIYGLVNINTENQSYICLKMI